DRIVARIWIRDHRALADVFSDLSAVAAGIQRGDDAATVWSNPIAYVERNAARRFLDRTRTANWRRGIPCELLRRETFQTSVRENARQRRWKTKTIRQHVLSARLAKLTLEKSIAVENLAKD